MRYLVLFTLLWWMLAGSHTDSWMLGVPVILLASYLAHKLADGQALIMRWRYIPQFVAYFLWQSVVAGFDVAKRTLSPSLPLTPGFVDYPMQLPQGAPRIFFGGVISLLPGTLCAELTDVGVRLHVLDTTANIERDCQRTERVIARLFGCNFQVQDQEGQA